MGLGGSHGRAPRARKLESGRMMHAGFGLSGSSSSSSSSPGGGGSLGLKHGEWPRRSRRLRLLLSGGPAGSATGVCGLGLSSLLPLFLSSTARLAIAWKLGAGSCTSCELLHESFCTREILRRSPVEVSRDGPPRRCAELTPAAHTAAGNIRVAHDGRGVETSVSRHCSCGGSS